MDAIRSCPQPTPAGPSRRGRRSRRAHRGRARSARPLPTPRRPPATVWTSGLNSSGQLGNGTFDQPYVLRRRAQPVQRRGRRRRPRARHRPACRTGRSAPGARGRRAPSATASLDRPAHPRDRAPLPMTATKVATGHYHCLVLLPTARVRTWGYNATGQLGDGTVTKRKSPVTVSGLIERDRHLGRPRHELRDRRQRQRQGVGHRTSTASSATAGPRRATRPVSVTGITNAVAPRLRPQPRPGSAGRRPDHGLGPQHLRPAG